ncbi:hypothetical protein GHT06_011173 [Daphnia sinensis]|uniref:Uncharacterized protein n=1 Tax=Daphnia sinensis TaxID=1820382 RepID=A0AAD5L1T1_9CRUS|nr:hypothetical protein GHT06_011173 [Daphnia sinensis]
MFTIIVECNKECGQPVKLIKEDERLKRYAAAFADTGGIEDSQTSSNGFRRDFHLLYIDILYMYTCTTEISSGYGWSRL